MKKTAMIISFLLAGAGAFAALGGIPFEVLHQTVGIRALSMGEATVASPEGSSILFWNPSVLDSVNKNTVDAAGEMLFEGASKEYISYNMPAGKYGGIGLMAGYLGYGQYENVDGSGVVGDKSDMKDIFLSAGYGRPLFAGIKGGLSLKFLLKYAADTDVNVFNSDIGFSRSFEMVDIGLAFKNIIPMDVKYTSESEKTVSTVRLGADLKLLDNRLKLALDMEKYLIKENPFFFAGVEYNVLDHVFLRAGYNTFSEISGGFGLEFEGAELDYALVLNELGMSHKIGLSYAFGGYETSITAEPQNFSPVGAYKRTYIRSKAVAKYEIYKWSIDIKDKKGTVIRTWSGTGTPDAEVIWDGLRADGMPYEDGDYSALLTIVDENDTTIKSSPTIIRIGNAEVKQLMLFGE
jgi:hypothetical protein